MTSVQACGKTGMIDHLFWSNSHFSADLELSLPLLPPKANTMPS